MRPLSSATFSILFLLSLITACSPVAQVKKTLRRSPVFNDHFTGFAIYDPQRGQMLAETNADRYFTPASNTKLFTLYTSLRVLGDSIPALKYGIRNDTLYFRGTGDPSLLHPDFTSSAAVDFLRQRPEHLVWVEEKKPVSRFGPGWSWDDYNDYYAAEKTALPLYGNVVRFGRDVVGKVTVSPDYFVTGLHIDSTGKSNTTLFQRSEAYNLFTYSPNLAKGAITQDVPFRYTPEESVLLLRAALQKKVWHSNYLPLPNQRVLYGIRADSLYKRLMQESDNFIAEQLLLLCSSVLFDSLRTESTIAYAKEKLLADLPDEPIWADGSGLSRYNLFTPRSIVTLLEKLYRQVPQERLFNLLAIGGRAGTIKRWYAAEEPFVFAKTGTLSNVHCLSGYLRTRKNKVLFFSFMHNNYTRPINDIRHEMDRVLRLLYEKY